MKYFLCSRNLKNPEQTTRKYRKLATFFHVAPWAAVSSIKKNGIFPGPRGVVSLFGSLEDAEKFTVSPENKKTHAGAQFAIIPVRVPKADVKKAPAGEAGLHYKHGSMIQKDMIAPKKYIFPVDIEVIDGVFYGVAWCIHGIETFCYEK